MSVKKVAFEFNPFRELGVKVPAEKKAEALDEVQKFIREKALTFIGEGKSPVQGGAWKRTLSPEYKKEKAKKSSADFANMELEGDMLDALEVKALNSERLSYGFFDEEQAAKADGHNNFSGKSKLPLRESVPNEKKDQTFNRAIWNGVKEILSKYSIEDEDG